MNTLKSGAIILVHGWVMLKGLDSDFYKVISQDDYSYTFAKKNGKKPVCRHYKSDIEGKIACHQRGDNNGIEIIFNG
jgi:hypothetical protein